MAIRGLVPRSRWYVVDAERLSLTFDPRTPYEEWEKDTRALLDLARGIQWLAGDALAFGEAAFGERASQVLDPDRYSWESVSRMARTSKAIPPGRRRAGVSYSVHAEVAALPPPQQEALLDHAEEHRSTEAEVRVLARRSRRRLERAAHDGRPVPAVDPSLGVRLGVADARRLPLSDATADLVVTSPPYGVEVAYRADGSGDVAADGWAGFMGEWLAEAYRVTKPHGRLALNVPLDTARGGPRPTYALAVLAALAVGWAYHGTIVWWENNTTKGDRALGSVDSAARPYHVSQVEMIGLFSKGAWGPSSSNPDDIEHAEWEAAGRGPWVFAGEGRAWEGRPAAFPVELPRRLIRYLSRRGDLVLDPFLGSGSTAVAASEAGRRCLGFDLDPAAIASSARRLAVISGGGGRRRGQRRYRQRAAFAAWRGP
jgi:site-specific DNA-methyltransferase (adenine-specific)